MKKIYLRNLVAVLMLLFFTNLTFGRNVKENESPAITVEDITVFTRDDGCSAVVNNYGASASAPSGIKSLSFNIAEGSVFSTGVTEVTARAEDNAGNVSFATFNVTVVDSVAPEFLSRESFIIFLDDNGVARVTPDDLNPDTIKDNCGVESITFDRTSFDCTEVGFHVINITATDASGNVTTGQADVEVRDEIFPEFLTRESFILQLDQNGVARISPDDFNRETISSNCDIVSLTIDRTEFNCNDVGFHVINVTATDRNGLSTTGQADVEVRDEIAPEFLTRESFILQLDQNGVARISPDDFNRETISSNCDIVSLTIDQTEFNCNDVGFHVINVTATDRNGLSTTGQADVEVRNEIAPEFLTRESFILQLDQNGVARISPDDFNRETISSNCDIVSLTIDQTEFNCNDVGFHVINVTATDRNGLSTTGQADVEVRDEIAPEFLTRESFILQLDQNGVARISPDDFNRETISSNCDIVSLTIDRTEFNCNDVGFHVINVTATDRNGLSTTGQADVEVRDEIAPEFLTRESFILQLDQNGVARISPDDFNRGTISSNCDIVSLTIDRTEFNCNDVGFHVVNVTATDRNGLSTTGQADVEVRDEIAPEFLTRESFILQLDQNGVARISPDDFNRETISSNCDIVSLTIDRTEFNCNDVGFHVINVTATDRNGLSTTGQADVEVRDEIAPEFLTRESFILQLDQNGVARISPDDFNRETISSNCDIVSLTIDRTEFNCNDVGFHVINVTAIDRNGLSTTGQADVEVRDEIAPEFLTRESFILQLDQNGVARISPDDFNRETISSNCDIVSLTIDRTEFNCNDVGFHVINVTATDRNGLSTTGQADVEVRDEIAPTVVTKNIIVELDGNGSAAISPADVDGGTFDNCAFTLSLNMEQFGCADLGNNVVQLTAHDQNGVFASASATVTVVDRIAPRAIARNITVRLGDDGRATVDPRVVGGRSTDNCGIVSYRLSKDTFTCKDIRRNGRRRFGRGQPVVLTVTDAAGNSSRAIAYINVVDRKRPEISDEPITLVVSSRRDAYLLRRDVLKAVSDNCGVRTVSFQRRTFTTRNTGINRVRVVAIDHSGNVTRGFVKVKVVNRDGLGSIVNMCFRGTSIRVSKAQVPLWLRRGASFGSCSNISSQPGGLEVQEEVQVESDINVVPEISLKSYPNPTSGYTVINFRSDVAGPAKVTVMNTKGVTMAVVFDKEVEAHQEVEVGYETGKLSNGVYLIRLVTAGKYRTIRLIVRK